MGGDSCFIEGAEAECWSSKFRVGGFGGFSLGIGLRFSATLGVVATVAVFVLPGTEC